MTEHKSYTKDLTMLGRPLKDIIIVDNSPHAYSFQPSNALPSITWEYQQHDTELKEFITLLVKFS